MFQILLPWQRGSLGEKIRVASFDGLSPKPPPYRRKKFADISYTDRVIVNFVPKFVAMETGVARREI